MMEHERFFRLLMVGLLGLAGLALIPEANAPVPVETVQTGSLKTKIDAAAENAPIDLELQALADVNEINAGLFKPELHPTGRTAVGIARGKFNVDFAEAQLRELENIEFEHSKAHDSESSIQL